MRKSLLKLRTESAAKNAKVVRATIPYESAKLIGLVFTVEDKLKHQTVKELISNFQRDGKEVRVLEFLPKKKDNPEFMFDYFSDQDLNFWGRITNEAVDKFSNIHFDYLLNLDLKSNLFILNLLAHSKASCRVGPHNDSSSLYFELMLQSNGSVKALVDSMYLYLKKIR